MRQLGITTVSVLDAIDRGVRFGFDICDATGLPTGTVYPALSRLERDGLVKSTWEEKSGAHAAGRPARRYYRITAAGTKALAEATSHYRALMPALGRAGRTKS